MYQRCEKVLRSALTSSTTTFSRVCESSTLSTMPNSSPELLMRLTAITVTTPATPITPRAGFHAYEYRAGGQTVG